MFLLIEKMTSEASIVLLEEWAKVKVVRWLEGDRDSSLLTTVAIVLKDRKSVV